VRDGFSSPTPVTVVGAEVLQSNATSNIADALNTMPNFAGSATPQTKRGHGDERHAGHQRPEHRRSRCGPYSVLVNVNAWLGPF